MNLLQPSAARSDLFVTPLEIRSVQIPIWVVALVLAVAAPLFVRGVAAWLAQRARARTIAALDRAREEKPSGAGSDVETDRPG
jgi:hypothetical protein